jgi:hypothetical protein
VDVLKLFDAYGLSGIVIGALFVSLWLLIKEIRNLNDTSNQRIDAIAENHSQERERWYQAYKENTEVLRQLTK